MKQIFEETIKTRDGIEITIEELYQAFKYRFIQEVREESNVYKLGLQDLIDKNGLIDTNGLIDPKDKDK